MSEGERRPDERVTRHLAALAAEPRPAGSAAESRARAYAAGVLRDAGFTVTAEAFDYSAFPGRFGTPIGGALGGLAVIGAAVCALRTSSAREPIIALLVGVVMLALFARAMLGDAVLDLPLLRARSENLVAVRGGDAPRVWLVAHLDSKSQPLPSAARIAGIVLVVAASLLATLSALLQLAGYPHRMGWWAAMLLALAGAPIVMASLVGARSAGAVDNASGVATVLLAAAALPHSVPIGVLLPSAEELGLAGARAWTRRWADRHEAGVALNCDGVDDTGALTIMYSGRAPIALIDIVSCHARPAPRVRRMPLGLLTDSVAFADRGWRAVTVSRGGVSTLRRIHTPHDTLDSLRGTGIESAATLLVRAVEALA